MRIARGEAEVVWEGSLARGTGPLKSGSSALDELDVTWAARTKRPDGETSPEDEVDGAPRITSVELAVRAQVPGLDSGKFDQLVGRAGDLCPVSTALRGNVEISARHEHQSG